MHVIKPKHSNKTFETCRIECAKVVLHSVVYFQNISFLLLNMGAQFNAHPLFLHHDTVPNLSSYVIDDLLLN